MPPELEAFVEERGDEGVVDDLANDIHKIRISSSFSVTNNIRSNSDIPSKFLSPLGFINYNHYGHLPWSQEDNIQLEPEFKAVTRVLGIDCEMVGVGPLQDSELGRVSIVNEHGYCVYDTFAKPNQPVTGYRSKKSGIYHEDLVNAPSVKWVVDQVKEIVKGKILVGHSIHNDLIVLRIQEHTDIRDTAVFFKAKMGKSGSPALKQLTKKFFEYEIQSGDHSSIQDAQATLKLYLDNKVEWEQELVEKRTLANLPSTGFNINLMNISDINITPRERDLFIESDSVFIRKNKIVGAYSSSEEYLDVQFRLLLEDFMRPMRYGVKIISRKGHKAVTINSLYRNVHIELPSQSSEVEVRAKMTLKIPVRSNKLGDVDWELSKLFMKGSLLLISPDNFKSVKFGVINMRPKDSSQVINYVRLQVLFCHDGPTWVLDHDPSKNNFIVMESKAYYEAYKHTLQYLQVMKLDKFPLKPYIVDVVTQPQHPKVLLNGGFKHKLDFAVFVGLSHHRRFADPFNTDSWPVKEDLGFDASQYEAFQKSITQEMSIIQGPPGTGKTFVGVQTIKFLLTNTWLLQGSPILIVAYTNHALDQTLEKVYEFTKDELCKGNTNEAEHLILRVGGGSKSEIIKPLTIFQKRETLKDLNALRSRVAEQKLLLQHLDIAKLAHLNPGLLNFQKIPEKYLRQLASSAGTIWSRWKNIQDGIKTNPVLWFGLSDIGLPNMSVLKQRTLAKYKNSTGKKGKKLSELFFFECPDLLTKVCQHKPNYMLNATGTFDSWISNPNVHLSATTIKGKTPQEEFSTRWAFYLYLVRQMTVILENLRHDFVVNSLKLEPKKDYPSLAQSKKKALVIGMTTTGAVKYKKQVVNVLKPKVVLVEEAAHVLEANVVASLTEDCEQIIMIGDHQQLRPLTADYELSNIYKLDVSLMERLVRNGIDQGVRNWVQLKSQHRMRPEIAKMICPVIYKELENHPCVLDFPEVRGVQKNIYFVDHCNYEARERGSSSFHNKQEATMVSKFVTYLVTRSKYKTSQITVIATYLAQKTLIENLLKKALFVKMDDETVRVSTVDGFQGEENDIIILSLCRSNKDDIIGFLKTDNRVNVALSRARHGLFMFGNMNCLKSTSDTWDTINDTLMEMDCIGEAIPLISTQSVQAQIYKCEHQPATNNNNGICKIEVVNPCSHKMAIECHKMTTFKCGNKCDREFKCGHKCRFPCHQNDESKHKNYRCLNKCQRKCPDGGHPCPGNHDCFANCSVNDGKGCKFEVSMKYGCGHVSEVVPCYKLRTEKKAFCSECLARKQKVQVAPKKANSKAGGINGVTPNLQCFYGMWTK